MLHELLSNIPLCRYATIFLSIHLLMDIFVVSIIWLLQIKLPHTFVYRPLCGHKLLISLG